MHNHHRHVGPLRFLCALSVLATVILPAWAETSVPDFVLVSHAGRYPSSVEAEDPVRSTVGIVYTARVGRDAGGPAGGTYATAFLVSTCYALTSRQAIEAIAPRAGARQVALSDDGGLMFSLVVKDGATRSTAPSWRSTVIASGGRLAGQSERLSWALLRLEGCENGGSPAPFDMPAAEWRTESAPVLRTRQLGILTSESIAGYDTGIAAAAWSMLGGPLQVFDADRGQWTTIGVAIAPHPERAGYPATSTANADVLVAAADDGATSFFRYEPQILPLAEIRDQISQAIKQDLMLN